MKIRLLTVLFSAVLFSAMPSFAAPLSVTASAVAAGGEYDYTYTFTVASGYSYNNFYLGSQDASPLNVAFTVNGKATSNWSWLGNDTPLDYLQFFSTNGSFISGETLGVTFMSSYAPGNDHFAEALNSHNGIPSNQITGLLGPGTATPEPMDLGVIGGALLGVGALVRRFKSSSK